MNEKNNANVQFLSLIMMLASAAWQQLGKIPNHVTGKVEKDINNAIISIDLLRMLKEKTTGNLLPEEDKMLTNTISDLELNYADEVNKIEQPKVN